MSNVIIPEHYHSCLSRYETQEAIGVIKHVMEKKLCMALKLKRVTAPLFVQSVILEFSASPTIPPICSYPLMLPLLVHSLILPDFNCPAIPPTIVVVLVMV